MSSSRFTSRGVPGSPAFGGVQLASLIRILQLDTGCTHSLLRGNTRQRRTRHQVEVAGTDQPHHYRVVVLLERHRVPLVEDTKGPVGSIRPARVLRRLIKVL